jgi:hypothetical protein
MGEDLVHDHLVPSAERHIQMFTTRPDGCCVHTIVQKYVQAKNSRRREDARERPVVVSASGYASCIGYSA